MSLLQILLWAGVVVVALASIRPVIWVLQVCIERIFGLAAVELVRYALAFAGRILLPGLVVCLGYFGGLATVGRLQSAFVVLGVVGGAWLGLRIGRLVHCRHGAAVYMGNYEIARRFDAETCAEFEANGKTGGGWCNAWHCDECGRRFLRPGIHYPGRAA